MVYRFNVITIKISTAFLTILILGFICINKCKGPTIAKIYLKKNEADKVTLPDFRTYYKTAVIKTVWYSIRIDI